MNQEKSLEKEKEEPEGPLVSSFEQLFDQVGGGYALLIYRESPRDLRGFLEEIPLNVGDEVIDLGYLQKKWGGEVLKVLLRNPQGKFCRRMLIELRSYPPLRDYEPVRGGPVMPVKDTRSEFFEMMTMVKQMFPPPIIPESPWKDLVPLIAPVIGALAKKIMEPPPMPAAPASQAQNLTEVMGALTMMKDFVQPPAEGGDIAGPLINLGQELLKSPIFQRPAPPQAAPQLQARVVPARPSQAAPPMPSSPPQSAPPQSAPPSMVPTEEQIMQFAQQKLAGLKGPELTKLYLDAIKLMPENEGRAAIDTLDEELGVDEDEPTETIPTPISGDRTNTDKRDTSNNRPINTSRG
jgi:hypothetical protein